MAGMNAEHINPFLIAATNVLKSLCMIDAKIGKPYLKDTEFTDSTLVIMIGITGEMRGQVMLAFDNSVACDIASKMCMMTITQMDEMSQSAICELTNMIMGNTATVFSTKGIEIDITPPTICNGNVAFTNNFTKNVCIPLVFDENKTIEFNLAIKDD